MKLKFSNFETHMDGKQMSSGPLAKQKARVIQLHEVAVSENQENREKNRPLRMHPERSVSGEFDNEKVKKLFDAIVYYANQCNFDRAQELYDKLVLEAPTAVTVIVKSGEIIEQRRKTAMDPEKIRPWADLFNRFTAAEAAAFYFALRDFVVKANQPVFQQGSCDTRLYFIHSGQLKLKYFDYDVRKNVIITTLRSGDIAGIETFFTLTNHTTNLVAAEESKISYLEKSDYQKIVVGNPGIEAKLFRYCESKQIRNHQDQPETANRRAHQRYKAELSAVLRRIDQNGREDGGSLEGKIVDISAGGVGYCVKNLKIGEAACLHNSRILIAATYSKYGLNYELKKTGKVVSLKFHPLGECSVHVQFEEPMDEDRVIEIAQHTDVVAYI